MKKRILSILLTLCMVLMLCPVTAFADDYYTITQNFKYGTRTYAGTDPHTSSYTFEIPAGGTCTLGTIEDCSPYELVGWQESGTETVYAPYAEIEVNSARTFDAVYQVQGGLTITVDGFMPGKTPNDCTYTFESTIPGVTFSADDIQSISWNRLVSSNGAWDVINSDDVFEAGTNYRIIFGIDNNGLELAPATTVNGNTPALCHTVTHDGVPYALEIGCELGTPVAPTLAVTVDNFEVGKKPNDITYSFTSTNLGVTFSESDILSVKWEVYDSYAEFFDLWYDWQEYQTGMRYRCTIELDSKGLTEAPAVTMNGKTPESCEIGTSGGKAVLRITCELGTAPAPSLTISGPDVVCAEQDCEFSATAAAGAEASYFRYQCGKYGGDTGWSRYENGVWYGAVPASEYGDADSIELTVYGTAANGKPATATKTVWISQDHVYENGVCGCGAVQQYTITYDGGEGVEGSIPSGTKTYGENFTLSSETFTREGYIQTGWRDMYGIFEYDLGGVYTWETDMTFYPVWEKLITVTVPYTTTVALGDVGEPGEATFDLAVIGDSAPDADKSNVTITGSVTTDGAGDYTGTLTVTGPEQTLWYMLSEGAFVQQVDDGADGWTVDDTVWGLLMTQDGLSADAAGYALLVVPTSVDDDGDYYINWNLIDWENPQSEDMCFTNTYTAHAYELNHDADGHWDECPCGDIQNEEAHAFGDWTVTKEATEKEAGEKTHTCTVCGYTEKAEIAKLPATTDPTNPDTKPETKPDTTSPQTGDNGHMALWFALLFVSGAGVIGTTVYGKKKRAK